MAATVQIVGYYGGQKQVVTTQRYSTIDQPDPGLDYPNNVPPSGETYYSYWVYTGAEITGGSYSQLSYWRWGTPGTYKQDWDLGSGRVVVALRDQGDHGIPVDQIEAASGIQGLTGYSIKDPVNGISYYKGQTTPLADADTYTAANPLVFDNTVYVPGGATLTKCVTHQLEIRPDTTFGEKSVMTTFIKWREI